MDEGKGRGSGRPTEPPSQAPPTSDPRGGAAPVRICICLGSSCFARGNGQNTRVIKEYLARSDATESVELVGLLCEGKCSSGPNLQINEHTYRGVSPAALVTILDHHLPHGPGEKSS